MEINKNIISEQTATRMQILSGFEPVEKDELNESLLSRVSGILGISIATLGSALAQSPQDFQKLQKSGYDQSTIQAWENSFHDSAVLGKLKQFGIPDNKVQKALDDINNGYNVKMVSGKPETFHHTAHDDEELAMFFNQGYHLTDIQVKKVVDTIKRVAPKSHVLQIPLILDDSAFFKSGKFELNDVTRDSIMSMLNYIKTSKNILLDVTIESSTDKQGLSPNLKNMLAALGYDANNTGLSAARNNTVLDFLAKNEIDTSIVAQNILHDQGMQTIDQNARYVIVYFDVLIADKSHISSTDSIETKSDTTYNLTKTFVNKKLPPITPPGNNHPCKIPIELFEKHHKYCPDINFIKKTH